MTYFFGEGRGGQGSEEDVGQEWGKGRTGKATEKQTTEAQPVSRCFSQGLESFAVLLRTRRQENQNQHLLTIPINSELVHHCRSWWFSYGNCVIPKHGFWSQMECQLGDVSERGYVFPLENHIAFGILENSE